MLVVALLFFFYKPNNIKRIFSLNTIYIVRVGTQSVVNSGWIISQEDAKVYKYAVNNMFLAYFVDKNTINGIYYKQFKLFGRQLKNVTTMALVIILGISAWFGDFSDTVGKGEDFILPTEKVTASKKCEMHDGLAKMNTKTTKKIIVFHALCGDGKKVTWQRG